MDLCGDFWRNKMENSFPWGCGTTGDGGLNSWTLEKVSIQNMMSMNVNPSDSGVVYWSDPTALPGFTNPSDELYAATNPSGDTVRIASGVGMIKGWLHISDDDVDFDVSGGVANAIDVIGLRLDLLSQTVRLFHGRGPSAFNPYVLVQTATIWEVELVQVNLDGSGNYSTHGFTGRFCSSPTGGRVPLYHGGLGTAIPITKSNAGVFSRYELQASVFVASAGTDRLDLRVNNDSGSQYVDSAGTLTTQVTGGSLTNTRLYTETFNIYPVNSAVVHIEKHSMNSPISTTGATNDSGRTVWRYVLPSGIKIDSLSYYTFNASSTIGVARVEIWGIK